MYQTFCISIGPCGPAVWTFWFSATGVPAFVVIVFFVVIRQSSLIFIGNGIQINTPYRTNLANNRDKPGK